MRHPQVCRFTWLLGCTLPFACMSAPSTEPQPAPETNAVSTLGLGATAGARPGDRNSDARTIDMLVDMQQPSAGIQFNERAQRNPGTKGAQSQASQQTAQPSRALTQVNMPASPQRPKLDAPATPPSGLFGSGATPAAVQTRSQSAGDGSSASSDAGPARTANRPAADLPPELKRWLHWPRQIAEYVRENRAFVFGCTAVLLVMAWTGSMMFSRRRG
jgi:hypothetical protein